MGEPEFGESEALQADLEFFPGAQDPPARIEPVATGASGRTFFRIRQGSFTRILMHYTDQPEDNRFFIGIAKCLHINGIPVPEILHTEPALNLIWTEDLGRRDLYSYRGKDGQEAAYRQAVEAIVGIQKLPKDLLSARGETGLPPFDEDLYRFEQNYFRTEFVRRTAPGTEDNPQLASDLNQLLSGILGEDFADVWVHRDFQSKNLMIDPSGHLRIVDFQGLRLGHRFYDLASLLDDAYVELDRELLEKFFRHFCALASLDPEKERSSFARLRTQRLLQALGAFGRFGLGRDIPFFRDSINPALRLLEQSAAEAELPRLSRLAAKLRG